MVSSSSFLSKSHEKITRQLSDKIAALWQEFADGFWTDLKKKLGIWFTPVADTLISSLRDSTKIYMKTTISDSLHLVVAMIF